MKSRTIASVRTPLAPVTAHADLTVMGGRRSDSAPRSNDFRPHSPAWPVPEWTHSRQIPYLCGYAWYRSYDNDKLPVCCRVTGGSRSLRNISFTDLPSLPDGDLCTTTTTRTSRRMVKDGNVQLTFQCDVDQTIERVCVWMGNPLP